MVEIKIIVTNLASALVVAIKAQEKYEREELNYRMDSGLLAGWRETLEAIKRGEKVEVV